MRIGVVVLNKNSAEEYFSSNEAREVFNVLLKNDINNALKVGYVCEINDKKYEIVSISIPEISIEIIDGVNAYLKLYVEPIE